ncbi:hypothetical protein Sjap_006080 [Stephania japonica]|uniref:NAC domain-containing protein n=1 Tax=Stephania japonica TaxID=461633 RepID=A0AAP0K7M8_9MAGN
MYNLPPGFKFDPIDEDIMWYLQRKKDNSQVPFKDLILDFIIYNVPLAQLIHMHQTEGDSLFGGEGEFEDKEEQVNFDETPKFDVCDEDFIEDRVIFGDDGHVIEVIPQSTNPRVLETVFDDGVIDNYLVEKVVKTKVKFAATKHFCSLTDDMDDELVVDALQDSHGGVFVDNFSLMVEVQDIVLKIFVPSSSVHLVKISCKDKFVSDYKSREVTKIRG